MAHNHNHEHNECCKEHGCGCEHNHEDIDKGQFLFKLIGGGFFLIAGYILNEITEKGAVELPSFTYLVCFLLSYLIVGFDIIKEAIEGIMHKDIFNENLLMTIASIGAFAVGEYSEGCMVVFLFTVGEFLQGLAIDKSRKSIKNMLEAKVEQVNIIVDGKEKTVTPEEVKVGDLMIIRPGEKLDIDGEIVEGTSQFDMKSLTGETIPITKNAGDSVLAGSVSLDGTVTVKAEKEYKDSTVSRILDMLEESQDKKSHAQKFITKFAKIYTPIVCLIAILIMVIPPLFFGGSWHEWLYRGLSALVVSCPCALVISIPLGFFAGIGACSKEGILVKGGNYLEALAKALSLLDDKHIEALGYALGTFLAIKGTLKFSQKIIGVVSSIRALRTIFSGLGTVLSTASGALQAFFGSGLGSTLAAGFADSMVVLGTAMAGFNLGKWISVNLFGGEDKTFGEFLEDNVFGYQKGDFTGAINEWMKDIFGVGDKLTEDDLKVFQEYEDAILGLVRASQISGEQAYPLLTFLSELKDNGYSTEQALFELELKLNNLGVSSEDFENAIAGVNKPVKDLGDTAETSSNQFSNMADRINNVSFEDISEQLTGFQTLIQTVDFATLVTDTANAIDEMGGIWENGKQILGEKALQIYQEISKGLDPDDNGYYTLANGQMVQFGKGISDYESTLQSTMDSTLQGAINGVLDNNSGFELVTELGKNQILAVGSGIEQNGGKVTEKLNSTIQSSAKGAEETAKSSGVNLGSNIAEGLQSGIDGKKESTKNSILDLMNNSVKSPAQEAVDSHSPSRWFKQLAEYCGQGFQNGLEPGFSASFTWFGRIRTRISNSIGNLYNVGWNSIIGLNNGIVGAAQQLYANVQKIAQNISNTFRSPQDSQPITSNDGTRWIHRRGIPARYAEYASESRVHHQRYKRRSSENQYTNR